MLIILQYKTKTNKQTNGQTDDKNYRTDRDYPLYGVQKMLVSYLFVIPLIVLDRGGWADSAPSPNGSLPAKHPNVSRVKKLIDVN